MTSQADTGQALGACVPAPLQRPPAKTPATLTQVYGWFTDVLDTQSILAGYAAVALVIGASVVGAGIQGTSQIPRDARDVLLMFGVTYIAAAIVASGLKLNEDRAGRRRGLRRFGEAHLLLGFVAAVAWVGQWREAGLPAMVAFSPLVTGFALLAFVFVDFDRESLSEGESSAARSRSRYDEHLRQAARREERARLARDLHDAVKQQLFVIQTAAATAQERLAIGDSGAQTALGDVRTAAREATTEMEALLEELQAVPTENVGLVEALKKQCEALALRTGARVDCRPGGLPQPHLLPVGTHEAAYRVSQEALANVARHARAKRVTVALGESNGTLEVSVTDDGQGFDTNGGPRGMGLRNMRARAAELGGAVEVMSSASGTAVRLTVPLLNPAIRTAWFEAFLVLLFVLSLWLTNRWTGRPILSGIWDFGVLWACVAVWRFVSARRLRGQPSWR